MVKRSSQTFAKRQREIARMEKQERKRAKRLERKQLKATQPKPPEGAEFEVVSIAPGEEQPSEVE